MQTIPLTDQITAMEPITARCQSCGNAYDEAAVLALAPVCKACGSVGISLGGTLGTVGAFGVNDRGLTRQRIQADLDVLLKAEQSYVGMVEASIEQLRWGAERYAELPPAPMLKLIEIKKKEKDSDDIDLKGCLGKAISGLVGVVVSGNVSQRLGKYGDGVMALTGLSLLVVVSVAVYSALTFAYEFLTTQQIRAENGRRKADFRAATAKYETTKRAALLEAEKRKAAEDYRLQIRVRDAEGHLETLRKKISMDHELLRKH